MARSIKHPFWTLTALVTASLLLAGCMGGGDESVEDDNGGLNNQTGDGNNTATPTPTATPYTPTPGELGPWPNNGTTNGNNTTSPY